MSTPLADLEVLFSVKGAEVLLKELESVRQACHNVAAAATAAFGRAQLAVTGFATAGVWASSTGDVLSYQFGEISRQIASLFVPELRTLVSWLQKVIDQFRALDGSQQRMVANFAIGGAALLGVTAIAPKLVGALSMATSGVYALGGAFVGLGAAGYHLLGILPAIGRPIVFAAANFAGLGRHALTLGMALSGLGGSFVGLLRAIPGVGAAITGLQAAIAATSAALAPAISGVYSLAVTIGGPLTASIGAATAALLPALPAILGVGLAFAALGAGIVAATGGIEGLVGLFEPISEEMQAAGERIVAAFESLFPTAMAVLEALMPMIATVAELAATVAEILAPALTLLGEIFAVLLRLMDPFLKFITMIANTINDTLQPAISLLTGQVHNLGKAIKDVSGQEYEFKVKTPDLSKKAPRQELGAKVGGFEGLDSAYQRLAIAGLKSSAGKSVEEQHKEVSEKQLNVLEQMKTLWERIRPLVSKG